MRKRASTGAVGVSVKRVKVELTRVVDNSLRLSFRYLTTLDINTLSTLFATLLSSSPRGAKADSVTVTAQSKVIIIS